MEIKRFEFFLPFKPFIITQGWGIYNPAYKEKGLSFTNHNGLDVIKGSGLTKWNIYAPFDYKVINALFNDTAGYAIRIESKNEYLFDDGKNAFVQVDFLHLDRPPMFKIGHSGRVGDLIAIADNTGYSTGAHTHIQPKRIYYRDGIRYEMDTNNANNSFDPSPYLSKLSAQEFRSLQDSLFPIPLMVANIAQKLEEYIKSNYNK